MIRVLIDVSNDASWVEHYRAYSSEGKAVAGGRVVLGEPSEGGFAIIKDAEKTKEIFDEFRKELLREKLLREWPNDSL
jgi:hypothetical protein